MPASIRLCNGPLLDDPSGPFLLPWITWATYGTSQRMALDGT